MKFQYAMIAGASLMSLTPVLAAVPQVEAYCFAQAELMTPALTQEEQDEFIDNCITNSTAGAPPAIQG